MIKSDLEVEAALDGFGSGDKSAASAASLTAWEEGKNLPVSTDDGQEVSPCQIPSRQGGHARSRLDHGLEVWLSDYGNQPQRS